MTKLKNSILKAIKEGRMSCWQCKRPIILDNIAFVDIDNRQIGYSCAACGNGKGLRSFDSVGLDFKADDLDRSDMASPFQIVANGAVLNPRFPSFFDVLNSLFGGASSSPFFGTAMQARKPAKIVKIDTKDAKQGVVDLDALDLDPAYKESILSDMKSVGEKEFWKGIRQSAMMNQKSLSDFIKDCEKDFIKSSNRPVRKKVN